MAALKLSEKEMLWQHFLRRWTFEQKCALHNSHRFLCSVLFKARSLQFIARLLWIVHKLYESCTYLGIQCKKPLLLSNAKVIFQVVHWSHEFKQKLQIVIPYVIRFAFWKILLSLINRSFVHFLSSKKRYVTLHASFSCISLLFLFYLRCVTTFY